LNPLNLAESNSKSSRTNVSMPTFSDSYSDLRRILALDVRLLVSLQLSLPPAPIFFAGHRMKA